MNGHAVAILQDMGSDFFFLMWWLRTSKEIVLTDLYERVTYVTEAGQSKPAVNQTELLRQV